MTRKDFPAFSRVVVGFAELKGKKLSEAAIELYWHAMKHWPLRDFQAAAEQLLRTSVFMPTPKEFEDLRKVGHETAPEAWIEILRRARSGEYGTVGLSSAARLAVAALGGIQTVAMSETNRTQFLERRFCEHYDTLQDAYAVRSGQEALAHSEQLLEKPHAVV